MLRIVLAKPEFLPVSIIAFGADTDVRRVNHRTGPLEPEVADTAAVGGQVYVGVKAVEMVDGDVRDRLRCREAQIHGHAAAPVRIEAKGAPAYDTGAVTAE